MIRTFGLGPRVKKCLFGRLGQDLRPKTLVNPKGKCKNNALGKNDHFRTFVGSVDGHIVPIGRNTVSLDRIAYSSAVLFRETLFLRMGPLFLRLGPRVSLIRTFSKTQRSYSNETPCIDLGTIHVIFIESSGSSWTK